MKNEDYKEIARIVNTHLTALNNMKVVGGMDVAIDTLISVINNMADYFEKDNIYLNDTDIEWFNKQQFLSDCGVE